MSNHERRAIDRLAELLDHHLRLWQAWLPAGQVSPPTFAELLRHWQREQTGTEPLPEEVTRLLAQGEAFVRLAEESVRLLADTADTPATAEMLARLHQAFPNPLFHSVTAPPPDTPDWEALRERLPAAFRALLPWAAGSDWSAGNPLQAELRKALGIPGIGLPAAAQARWTELAELWAEHQAADAALREHLAAAARQALLELQQRLEERHARGEPITSLRAFYDLWIDASERAYAAMLRSDDYAQAQGRAIHAMLRCRRQAQLIAEDLCAAFGLPGRTEMDATQAALHETRQRLRLLETEFARLRADGYARTRPRTEQRPGSAFET